MSKIPTQLESPNGFHQRYEIRKVILSDLNIAGADIIDPNNRFKTIPIDPGSEYFVMRLDEGGKDIEHIKACRIAVNAYADAIEHHLPQLAKDLRNRYPVLNKPSKH